MYDDHKRDMIYRAKAENTKIMVWSLFSGAAENGRDKNVKWIGLNLTWSRDDYVT